LPFQRMRREAYQYREQLPSEHVENLNWYLLIALSLVPRDPTLSHFRIRHPDLQQNNIIVSKSHGSKWQIAGLIDWQHASILPLFLFAGIPGRLQNYDDPISQSMMQPSLPDNFADLDKAKQNRAKELYRRRLVHYHYVKDTEECNELHYKALTDPAGVLCRRLFDYAGNPWEGETLELKLALIEAMENWEALTDGSAPCPVVFEAEDVRETTELDVIQRELEMALAGLQNIVGFSSEGWVRTENYEGVMFRSKKMKEGMFARAESAEERAEIAAHWPLDDMDEEKYA
jgi:hypothetical protein